MWATIPSDVDSRTRFVFQNPLEVYIYSAFVSSLMSLMTSPLVIAEAAHPHQACPFDFLWFYGWKGEGGLGISEGRDSQRTHFELF